MRRHLEKTEDKIKGGNKKCNAYYVKTKRKSSNMGKEKNILNV